MEFLVWHVLITKWKDTNYLVKDLRRNTMQKVRIPSSDFNNCLVI